MKKLNEDAAAGCTSAGAIAGNRGSIFPTHTEPMRRQIPVAIPQKKKKSKLINVKKMNNPKWGFGTFLANNMGNPMSETFDFSSISSKADSVLRQTQAKKENTQLFGLEDSNGQIVKVYVDAANAKDFELALSRIMEEEMESAEIAEILFKLKDEFNIVNVVWPKIHDDAMEEEENSKGNSEDDVDDDLMFNDDQNDEDTTADEFGEGDGTDNMSLDDIDLGGDDENNDNIDVNNLPAKDFSAGSESESLSNILSMLSAEAEARKAEADARKAEARAKEAEAVAKAAEAKIKAEEQVLDMEAYNKDQNKEKLETRKLAKLAKYRHEIKQNQQWENEEDVVDLNVHDKKTYVEEEEREQRGSSRSITPDMLMKIIKQMQRRENSQE